MITINMSQQLLLPNRWATLLHFKSLILYDKDFKKNDDKLVKLKTRKRIIML
jgi:hypothetical protein